jgi:4-hydroxybenzoate polyprenyltransferase
MTHLFSLLPPIAWILLFLILLFSVSYLYIKNKNLGKVVIGLFFIFAAFGGWNVGQHLAETTAQEQVQ